MLLYVFKDGKIRQADIIEPTVIDILAVKEGLLTIIASDGNEFRELIITDNGSYTWFKIKSSKEYNYSGEKFNQ
jgi:hypothetical protein